MYMHAYIYDCATLNTSKPPAVSFLKVHTKPIFSTLFCDFFFGFNVYSAENRKSIYNVFRPNIFGSEYSDPSLLYSNFSFVSNTEC